MILIFTTFDKKSTATKVGKALLKKRLIACYNLMPIESAYWWQGKIVNDREVLMILKTQDANFFQIEKYLKDNSSYQTPEIIAVKANKVHKPYLSWLDKETK